MSAQITMISLELLHTNLGTQLRDKEDSDHIDELREAYDRGDPIPPIQVVSDGENYWPWDGHHRIKAAKRADKKEIEAVVTAGKYEDAILLSAGANAAHLGLRRTSADKRHAIATLLLNDEWRGWSDRVIAEKVGVDDKTVGKVRAEMVANAEIPHVEERKQMSRDGKVTTRKVKAKADEMESVDAAATDAPASTPAPSAEDPHQAELFTAAKPITETTDNTDIHRAQPVTPKQVAKAQDILEANVGTILDRVKDDEIAQADIILEGYIDSIIAKVEAGKIGLDTAMALAPTPAATRSPRTVTLPKCPIEAATVLSNSFPRSFTDRLIRKIAEINDTNRPIRKSKNEQAIRSCIKAVLAALVDSDNHPANVKEARSHALLLKSEIEDAFGSEVPIGK